MVSGDPGTRGRVGCATNQWVAFPGAGKLGALGAPTPQMASRWAPGLPGARVLAEPTGMRRGKENPSEGETFFANPT